MRNFAKVKPQFWIGETGRNIRSRGQDHITVALYLMSCPSPTMIGLYYLPVTTLALETGFDSRLWRSSSDRRRSSRGGENSGYRRRKLRAARDSQPSSSGPTW